MALNVDTTRAARSAIARRQLVDAVLAAPIHEQELDWVEWKVPPDIRALRAVIAKQILAFANREVSRAARTAEGCGYLLLGASPGGNLAGVTPVDPADLSSWLDPYVGGVDGPQWDADYVDISGKAVLVITVASPRDGDRPWPLRKEWNDGTGSVLQEGTIFTRRMGKSGQANAAEQDMLLTRSRAAGRRLSVEVVRSDEAVGRTYDASPEKIAEWIDRERIRLLAPLKPKPTVPGDAPGLLGSQYTLARLAAEMAKGPLLGGLPEDRTKAQYGAEVDEYLAAASAAMPRHARWRAVSGRLATLRLQVVNLTEVPYAKLEVQMHIPGAVRAFWTPWHARPRDDLPSPPRLWGPRTTFGPLGRDALTSSYLTRSLLTPAAEPIRGWIKNSGSATVTFMPFDLRPTETAELDEVLLAADASLAGQTVVVTWQATSTNAHGRNSGEFNPAFAPGPVSLVDLLQRDEDREAYAEDDE